MKRTRQKDREVPEPPTPWNEIVPGLWMGGHYWTDAGGETQFAVVDREFDLVVSLYTRPGHGPAPGVEHVVAELPDGPLAPSQLRTVQQLAQAADAALREARKVLVRCASGYNRSGLVVAQTLVEQGRTPASAVEVIRRRRSPWALNNETFVDYLTAGIDVAVLLTGLDTDAPG